MNEELRKDCIGYTTLCTTGPYSQQVSRLLW